MTRSWTEGTFGKGPVADGDVYGAMLEDTANSGGGGSSFGGAFSKNFLDIYKNKMSGGGGSSSSNSKVSPFQVSDMGGSTISQIGEGKHHLLQYIGAKPIIQAAGAPGGPGIGGQIAGAAAGAGVSALATKFLPMMFCDERLKIDMAPLESTEVNDALAEVAFFVKGLRECA